MVAEGLELEVPAGRVVLHRVALGALAPEAPADPVPEAPAALVPEVLVVLVLEGPDRHPRADRRVPRCRRSKFKKQSEMNWKRHGCSVLLPKVCPPHNSNKA